MFLADNHAETFGWITRTFDLDGNYQFVLVDAHSDASMAGRSEEIREQIRRVPSEQERANRVEQWRESGRIQAFNWIEPLMPRPLDRVLWLAAPDLTDSRRAALTREATESLDGRLEVEPRSAGSMAGRWNTVDLAGYEAWSPGGRPVVLAIDLDFFASMEATEREEMFDRIWRRAMDWQGLCGVAFAVSRPWLGNDAEAEALVQLACDAVSRTRGAVLEIDASFDDRPDDSLKAGTIRASGETIPRWDLKRAGPPLHAVLEGMDERLRIIDRKREWNQEWPEVGWIQPDGGVEDCDGVWRFAINRAPALRVDAPSGATGRVRWFSLESSRMAYDLIPETGLGKSFSTSPARWIYETRRSLGTTADFALAAERWRPASPGRMRISAEIETTTGWLTVPPIEIRLLEGSGFHAALSECFGMPYVFGIAGVSNYDLIGVETGWGSDCSNFLIHAWRRDGIKLTWGDPGRLRSQLATIAEDVSLESPLPIKAGDVERGLMIDLGRHVAAVWEDCEPRGQLGENDLVAHHLGGIPEVVTLAELTSDRPVFSLRTAREPEVMCVVRVAGDVVLSGNRRWVAPGFEKGDAGLFLANLEGVPSMRDPEAKPIYDFRFPPEALGWLKERGVDVVSMANNHAGDAGREGLMEGIAAVRAAGMAVVGAGENSQEACKPWRGNSGDVPVAVFGVCLVDTIPATNSLPGVAKLPDHTSLLESGIREAVSAGDAVVVLVHGGDEYKTTVNDEQRKWARSLVKWGADLIVGAHPHVVQRTERQGGSMIAHSLGNAVYPAELSGAGSGEVRDFKLGAKRTATSPSPP